jgi:SAM-dependent methyltransferase
MDTRITSENPHGCSRHGFAWEKVPQNGKAHLDFGCYDAVFLESLKGKDIGCFTGVDVSQDAIHKANEMFPEIEAIHITKAVPLPFDDKSFTSISMMDVLEHVYEQRELLKELHRVLDDDGILIVTVPGRHVFSFLDMGNFKFYFPKLHRWYYCLNHSKDEYERRYVSNPDGLIGDISMQKRWHEHFSRKKLRNLLRDCGFVVTDFDGTGFFFRIINIFSHFLEKAKFLLACLQKIKKIDLKLFRSANLFCVARKQLNKDM